MARLVWACSRARLVPMAYRLFSQTSNRGSRHRAARLAVSWNSPSAKAPSPKKQQVTRVLPRIRSASASPAARQAAGHDRVAPVEAVRGVEQVHGAAASAAAAGGPAVHLGHHGVGGNSASQCVPVFAVGGDHRVLLAQCLVDAHGDGFLTDVEVDEPTDLRAAVELHAPLLEPSDGKHPAEQGQVVPGCGMPVGSAAGSGGGSLLAPAPARCAPGLSFVLRGGAAHGSAFSHERVSPGSPAWTDPLRAIPFPGRAADGASPCRCASWGGSARTRSLWAPPRGPAACVRTPEVLA